MENTIVARERPKTMLTPEVKRKKTLPKTSRTENIAYPTTIQVPSLQVIKALYKTSVEEGCEGADNNNKSYNDQQYLTPAGVLSFEEVLLPAIGLEEEKAIKRAQSLIQRDASEYRFVMENCRRLVRESVRCAMHEVQSSRTSRIQRQQDRREKQAVDAKLARENRERLRQQEQERLKNELAQRKEISRGEKKRHLSRKHPRNQELWKEIVFLTSSVAQLEREEHLWNQIELDMTRLEGKRVGREENSKDDTEEHMFEKKATSSLSKGDIYLQAQKNPLQYECEEMVKDIVLTSTRIQKGLGMVLELLNESETCRKELYDKYKKDHVFRGYQSVHNPKNLIRFLSQSQDDL